mmetsp:Transcript_13110/g.52279  ORF Transcript_13110/g.52279 Transcript_13110/m.52279 type:complete len:358 (+) Transcript_13110:425-1498(+)
MVLARLRDAGLVLLADRLVDLVDALCELRHRLDLLVHFPVHILQLLLDLLHLLFVSVALCLGLFDVEELLLQCCAHVHLHVLLVPLRDLIDLLVCEAVVVHLELLLLQAVDVLECGRRRVGALERHDPALELALLEWVVGDVLHEEVALRRAVLEREHEVGLELQLVDGVPPVALLDANDLVHAVDALRPAQLEGDARVEADDVLLEHTAVVVLLDLRPRHLHRVDVLQHHRALALLVVTVLRPALVVHLLHLLVLVRRRLVAGLVRLHGLLEALLLQVLECIVLLRGCCLLARPQLLLARLSGLCLHLKLAPLALALLLFELRQRQLLSLHFREAFHVDLLVGRGVGLAEVVLLLL